MGRFPAAILILAGAIALSACARSGDPQASSRDLPAARPATLAAPSVAQPSVVAPFADIPAPSTGWATPGARAYLDPETGAAREPTRAEVAAAASASGRVQREAVAGQAASEGTQREHFVMPDGTEGVKLAPGDRHSVVVCMQPDGSVNDRCPRPQVTAKP